MGQTGCEKCGLGNRFFIPSAPFPPKARGRRGFDYVYAVGNPEVGTAPHRYDKSHQKVSGFGLVTIDLKAKTYHCEAFKFLVDATDGKADNQFPGWPLTIHQAENRGENRVG